MKCAAGDDWRRVVIGRDHGKRNACAVFAVLRIGIAGRDAFGWRRDHGLAFAVLADFVCAAIAVLGAFRWKIDTKIIDALLICGAVGGIEAFERVDAFAIRAILAWGAVVVVDAFWRDGLGFALVVFADLVCATVTVFGAFRRDIDAKVFDALLVCGAVVVIEAFDFNAFAGFAELVIIAIGVFDTFSVFDALIVDAMLIGCAVRILEAFTLYDANVILANLVAEAV